MNIQNPFLLTGFSLPEHFCDRVEETSTLINNNALPLNTALFSIRRLGKTGLILNTINSLQKSNIKCIYLDIMMTNNTQDFTCQFAKAFFNQGVNLKQKLLKNISNIFYNFAPSFAVDSISGQLSLDLKLIRNESFNTDLENIFEYIKNSNDRYFIAIDEFQQILNYPEKNFEAFLRSKIQFLNNASFVFSGSKKNMLLSIFGDYSKPLWQACSYMELKPIDKYIYFDFVQSLFNKNKQIISNDSWDYIYDNMRGITYFIQLICNHLYNDRIKDITINSAKDVLNKIIKERESYYYNLSNLLTHKQLELLIAIAKEDGIEQPMGKEFIHSYNLGSASTIKSALDNLISKEVIYNDSKKYYLTDVLFSQWLKNI